MTPERFCPIEALCESSTGRTLARLDSGTELAVRAYAFSPTRARALRDWLTRALGDVPALDA